MIKFIRRLCTSVVLKCRISYALGSRMKRKTSTVIYSDLVINPQNDVSLQVLYCKYAIFRNQNSRCFEQIYCCCSM